MTQALFFVLLIFITGCMTSPSTSSNPPHVTKEPNTADSKDVAADPYDDRLNSVSTGNDVRTGVAMTTSFKLPDVLATYGKLFSYKIPGTDSVGRKMASYQIYAGNNRVLPDWLVWNQTSSTLEGIPPHDLVERKYPIVIVAELNKDSIANSNADEVSNPDVLSDKDINQRKIGQFFITITRSVHGIPHVNTGNNGVKGSNNSVIQSKDVDSAVECTKPGSSVTKAIVVLDVSTVDLTTTNKIDLLRRFASYLQIDLQSISIVPLSNLQTLAVSALVSKRGYADSRGSKLEKSERKSDVVSSVGSKPGDGLNSKAEDHQEQTSRHTPATTYASLQWVVGCGNVQTRQMKALIRLEKSVEEGRLSAALGGLGVKAWYVINIKPPRSKRSAKQQKGRFSSNNNGGSRIYRDGNSFKVERLQNHMEELDIYAASGFDGQSSSTPTEDVFKNEEGRSTYVSMTSSTTTGRHKIQKSSKKPKTKKPKPFQPVGTEFGSLEGLRLYVGRPFFFDLSKETTIKDEPREYIISHKDMSSLPPNAWIRVNSTSPQVYGFPLDNHVGEFEFLIFTTKGKFASMDFSGVVVKPDLPSRPNHEFCMTIDQNYDKFIYDVETRINVASKLSEAFGSYDPTEMTVLSISEGSVVYTWYNNSLPQEYCDDESLLRLMDRFLSSSGALSDSFKKSLDMYKPVNASISTFGLCSHIPPRPNIRDFGRVSDEVKKDKIDSDRLFYVIVGLIAAAAVILIIVLIVLIIFCRHKKNNNNDKQKQLFKSAAPSKGVPVIFAEELQAAEKEEDRKSQRGEEGLPDTARSTLRSRRGSDEGNLNYDKRGVPPPVYQPPRPGSRDALKGDMILEGLSSNARSPLIKKEDNNNGELKISFDDGEEDNVDNFFNNRTSNFKRGDNRIRQENRKNQLIVSDID